MDLSRLATWGLLACSCGAAAHEGGVVMAASHWTFDPWVVAPLAASALLFLVGSARLYRQAGHWHERRAVQAGSYAAGWLVLAGALVSPLHWLGEHLFTFHMIEHELVMAVAAPLFVVARPIGTLLWALPTDLRHAAGGALARTGAKSAWTWLTRPRTATVIHGAVIWIWHLPALFDATIVDLTLHRLQHLCFLVSALLFWWSVLRRSSPGVAVWHLFVTMVHTSVLGALMALAPRVLYHLQTAGAPAFGLTSLEDQQFAGIIMWVPAETVYAGVALAMAALWIRQSRGSAAETAAAAATAQAN